MDGLFRRGGVWWARIVVPTQLRQEAGRREFVKSTRAHDLPVAKLVASIMLSDWRRQLFKLGGAQLDDENILKLVRGSPILALGGFITLNRASEILGLDQNDLLTAAAVGHLTLHYTLSSRLGEGFVVPKDALEPIDVEVGRSGGVIVPNVGGFPHEARAASMVGQTLPLGDGQIIARQILADKLSHIDLVAFDTLDRPDWLFVPNETILALEVGELEVVTAELETCRAMLSAKVPKERIKQAYAARTANVGAGDRIGGKWAAKRFSWAVERFCSVSEGLPASLADQTEIRQQKSGLLRFSEFMGDLRLSEIDADLLRRFRDGPLKTFPAKINNLPREIRRATMKETIHALTADGRPWPLMTSDRRHEQMQWLFRFFRWLYTQERLSKDLSDIVRGETGMTKAEKNATDRVKDSEEGRRPFTDEELKLIFGVTHYKTGNGKHLTKENAKWYPFQYWLPLLGIYAGLRIKEASQLHLSDVATFDGVWCLHINELTADKKLKNVNARRIIPVHLRLIELGFVDYCQQLTDTCKFLRVFPELTYSLSPARYAKNSILKMSEMLNKLGMPRDNTRVFHNFRKNINDKISHVPLPSVDARLGSILRYELTGHELPGKSKDANAKHYTTTQIREKETLINGVAYDLPEIARFDIAAGIGQVAIALNNKLGARYGKEDMGPLNT